MKKVVYDYLLKRIRTSDVPEGGGGASKEYVDAGLAEKVPKKLVPITLTGATVAVNPSKCYEWNATGICNLNAEGWSADGEEWTTMYINVAEGAVIKASANITMTGVFVAGKMNFCQLKGFKGQVRLYVLEVY